MNYYILVIVIILLLFVGCAKLNLFTPKNDIHIMDNQGRIVIYHGLNVSNYSKGNFAGNYQPWQTEEDYAKLNKWGFNLVRYLVFWNAVEPVEGMINYAYLKETVEQINKLNKIGVDVVIDLHQDLYGPVPEFRGIGNGFPDWTAKTNGFPFELQTPWSKNYLQPAMLACYANFWKDNNLQDKYVNYVKKCYETFDSLPNVVGFDLMNEPFPALPTNTGDLKGKSIQELALAKDVAIDLIVFETKTLPHLYYKIQTMKTDNKFKKPMWFEPAIWTSSGIPSILNFKPTTPSVYFPHYYDINIHEGKPYTKTVKNIMKVEIFETILNAKRFKTPVLFGEFGAPSTAEGYLDYLGDFLNLTDKNNIGWTYFTFDRHPFGVLDNDGKEAPQLGKLVRIYPQRIAGINPKYKIKDNTFILNYIHTLDAETVIFVPLELKGVMIKVNDLIAPYLSGLFTWNKKGETKIEITWESK